MALYEVYDFINLRYFSIFKFVKVKNAISHNFLWRFKSNKWTFCPRCDGICCMGCSIIFGRKNNLSECLIVKSFIDWYMFTQPPAEKRKKINAFQTSIWHFSNIPIIARDGGISENLGVHVLIEGHVNSSKAGLT